MFGQLLEHLEACNTQSFRLPSCMLSRCNHSAMTDSNETDDIEHALLALPPTKSNIICSRNVPVDQVPTPSRSRGGRAKATASFTVEDEKVASPPVQLSANRDTSVTAKNRAQRLMQVSLTLLRAVYLVTDAILSHDTYILAASTERRVLSPCKPTTLTEKETSIRYHSSFCLTPFSHFQFWGYIP